jgi:hypothetical protein
MKLFGYAHETKAAPLELYEVTVSASPAVLRELAAFLEHCASGIEAKGASWNHEHFVSGDNQIVKRGPEFVVYNPGAE